MGKYITWPLKDLQLVRDYGLKAPELKNSGKSVLQITDQGKDYALKLVTCSERKLHYFQEVLRFITDSEFNNYPKVLLSVQGKPYVQTSTGSYILSEWLPGRAADFTSYDDIIFCAKTLGQLHKTTMGYLPAENNWEERWKSGLKQYKQLKLSLRQYPEEVRQLMTQVIKSGQRTLALLRNKQIYDILGQPAVLCHQALYEKNFLIAEDNTSYLLGLCTARADMPQRDVAQFLRNVLIANNGDINLALKLIAAYCHENPFSFGDLGAVIAFMYFPRSLWSQVDRLKSNNPEILSKAVKAIREDLALQPAVHNLAMVLGY
ncbi:MAG TPA: phosphotransferase [Candidatus Deferrimicrobium sp.]|nr:phosphotransferase [Candidatus Deferrimicrobium sp.]